MSGRRHTGRELARLLLEDLASKIGVPKNLFFMVPGNHDIVRHSEGNAAAVQDYLLHYDHEEGFRALREEFCEVYRLSPLNYIARVRFERKTLVFALLNSPYLNERVSFSEYGFVGDDADNVFAIIKSVDSPDVLKILVLHHHLLPVYERELLGSEGKISLTLDAAKILRQAQEANICLVLHGHEHAIKRMQYSSWSAAMLPSMDKLGRSLALYAGGSIGVKSSRLPSDELNAYGLIDISGQQPALRVRRVFANGRRGEDWESRR